MEVNMQKPFVTAGLILLIMMLAYQPAAFASAANPSIKFTYVPPYGIKNPDPNPNLLDSAKGRALNINPNDYYVACYIYVAGVNWWPKPFFDPWKTGIGANGNWSCDVSSSGIDEKATIIEAYLVHKAPDDPATAPSRDWLQQRASAIIAARRVPSIPSQDGWVLECNETSNTGCTSNAGGNLRAGDDAANKQYRSILSFSLANQTDHPLMPDGAVITRVSIKISKAGAAGTDPFTILGNLQAAIRRRCFGAVCGLETGDFQAAASVANIGSFQPINSVPGWYQVLIGANNYKYFDPTMNATNRTQFRIKFALDDNNNTAANYVSFYSGNAVNTSPMTYPALPPVLIIEYSVP
jgi:hypothetical protein